MIVALSVGRHESTSIVPSMAICTFLQAIMNETACSSLLRTPSKSYKQNCEVSAQLGTETATADDSMSDKVREKIDCSIERTQCFRCDTAMNLVRLWINIDNSTTVNPALFYYIGWKKSLVSLFVIEQRFAYATLQFVYCVQTTTTASAAAELARRSYNLLMRV